MLPPVNPEPFLIVHADARDPDAFEIERGIIEGAGARLKLTRADGEHELIANVRGTDALLVSGARITRAVVDAMPRCKLLVRYGVGLDSVDVAAATERGIVVAHFPDFCQPEVANHAIMLLLACAKKLTRLDRAVPRRPLAARAAGADGRGARRNARAGGLRRRRREVAPRAQALGLAVIAFDPYAGDEPFARSRWSG